MEDEDAKMQSISYKRLKTKITLVVGCPINCRTL
jgi:hypothetical protein